MDALVAHILDAAGCAPSAHNTQPWALSWQGDAVEVRIRPERTLPAGDPAGVDTLHALGAMLENILLTLAHLGYEAGYEVADPGRIDAPVLVVRWRPADQPPPDPVLYRMIPIRQTSRLAYAAESIPAETLDAIRAMVGAPCVLYTLTKADAITALRSLVTAATVEQLANARVSKELYGWMRFSPRDRRWYRDGLTADCMGWKPWEAAAARLLLAPHVLRWLARWGLHRVLLANVDQLAPPAPVLCLLMVEGDGVAVRVQAGRCLQRIWLAAAAHGLCTHPLSAAMDVDATRRGALELFGASSAQRHVSLFRLGRSAPPARSPRLPADELLDVPP